MEGLSSQNSEARTRDERVSGSSPEQQSKTRKRKGSLRKTALLGPMRSLSDKISLSPDLPKPKQPHKNDQGASKASLSKDGRSPKVALPQTESVSDASLHPPERSPEKSQQQPQQRSPLVNPLSSSVDPYVSTTSDEEITPQIPGSFQRSPSLSSQASSESPLAALKVIQSLLPPTGESDYSATEWWGWFILLATWIVFVVGMGSCLGVWSWVWDVGEDPSTPRELVDDPTLPIVGYYPALMVLTAVMCWVWVIVAWVGMKYFKHAKIQGDET